MATEGWSVSNTTEHTDALNILEKLRSRQKQLELTALVFNTAGVYFITAVTGILLERIFAFPVPFRTYLLLLIFLIPIMVFSVGFVRIIRDKRLSRGRYSEEWWALALGKFASDRIRDRLLNAIQINRAKPAANDAFSTDLARHALLGVVSDMKNIPHEGALDNARRSTAARTLMLSFVALALLIAVNPNSSFSAIDRILHPGTVYETPEQYTIAIESEADWAYRSEPVEFKVRIEGNPPERLEFVYAYDGGENQTEVLQITGDSAIVRFDGFPEPITYSARWKKISSPEYRLNIITRPQISELQYRLFPPQYSRLPVENGLENVGNVEALPGSRLELKFRSTKPLDKSWLVFLKSGADSSSADSIEFDSERYSGITSMSLYRNGSYHIRIRDNKGHFDKDPVTYRIKMLTDDPPSIRIAFPETDVELGDETILPLRLEADDDFGINRIQLAWRTLGEDTTTSSQDVVFDKANPSTVTADHLWDLGNMYLMPGDIVEYWAIAWDNDNILGPKSGESEHRLVRLPTIEEIFAELDETEEQGLDEAEQTLEAARDLREAMNEIVEEMRRNPEMDWEKQQRMEDALERQADLQKQVEDLAKTINELTEQLEKHDLASMETLEKYKQLQELIAEVATPEMKEAMDKLRKAMEEQDPDAIREALENFDMDREEFLQNIERSMEILQQLQLERRLDELVKQMEELLHDQEQVLDQMESEDSQKLAEDEKALAKSMETFEDRLEETKSLTEQSGDEQLQAELDSLMQALAEKDIPEDMRQVSQNLQQGQMNEAQEGGEQTARDLSEMLSQLSKASSGLKERRKNELAGKIRRLTEELLYVSEDQEDLAQASKDLGTQSPRYRSLAGRQDDIRKALKNMTNRLFEVSKETFFITPDLGASLGKASDELDKAVERYTSRNPRTVSAPQQAALGEINKSAKRLIDILGELQNSNSSTGYEEMMEKLSQMASQQQGLNQQSQSMPMPGQEGQQPMPGGSGQGQFSRMAAEQRALQQQMEELADKGQGMKEILGDLDGIAKAMGEVSDDLEEKNVNERTRRLQRQIVSRLLDATRSARQKEYSEKRESFTGKDIVRRPPPELQLDSDAEKLRRDLKRALQEGYTRDYRRLIRAYFQALEEEGKVK